AAPRGSGARRWAVGFAVCGGLAFVAFLLLVIARADAGARERAEVESALRGGPAAAAPAWGDGELKATVYLLGGLTVLAHACYLLFLRRVAAHFGRDGLAAGVVSYLVLTLLLGAGLLLVLAGVARPGAGAACGGA